MTNDDSTSGGQRPHSAAAIFRSLGGLALIFALPFVLAFGAQIWVDDLIDYQRARNAFLEHQISILDPRIREVRDLEETKQGILARANVIEHLGTLLGGFTDHLYLLSEAPPGVRLESVRIERGALQIIGKACCVEPLVGFTNRLESNPRVRELDLRRVSDAGAGELRDFEMSATLRAAGVGGDRP